MYIFYLYFFQLNEPEVHSIQEEINHDNCDEEQQDRMKFMVIFLYNYIG